MNAPIEAFHKMVVESPAILNLRGYSIYPMNNKFVAYFRGTKPKGTSPFSWSKSPDYIGTRDTLDECLDMLVRHIF